MSTRNAPTRACSLTSAREAAFEVVNKVNSRIPHIGMLALHVRIG